MIRRALPTLVCLLWVLCPAMAHVSPDVHVRTQEDLLVSGLSQDRVQITSTYSGTDMMIFGAIDAPLFGTAPSIVVVVRGPSETMTVRHKQRIAGIWLNTKQASFSGMPSYYYLASNQPLQRIATPGTLRRNAIGFDALMPGNHKLGGQSEDFRAALIRRMRAANMYTENDEGVQMLSPRLFRTHVPLPAAAPRGRYMVDVYLFRTGTLLSQQVTPFFVSQVGIERRIQRFSHTRPVAYGALAVIMAIVLGWLATFLAQLARRP